MGSLRRIPQQHMSIFCPRLVVLHDMQVGNGGHDVCVRVGVVHRGCAAGESRRGVKVGVWVAEVGDGGGAGVAGGRVGNCHVGFRDGDIFLFIFVSA